MHLNYYSVKKFTRQRYALSLTPSSIVLYQCEDAMVSVLHYIVQYMYIILYGCWPEDLERPA